MEKHLSIDEERLIERLAPRLEERMRYRVVESIIDTLEEEFYPPEDMIREEFIRKVEEAEQRVREGRFSHLRILMS